MRRCSYKRASDDTRAIFNPNSLFQENRNYAFMRGEFGFFDVTGKRDKKRYQVENFVKGVVLGHTASKGTATKLVKRLDDTVPKLKTKGARIQKVKNLFKYYGGIYAD